MCKFIDSKKEKVCGKCRASCDLKYFVMLNRCCTSQVIFHFKTSFSVPLPVFPTSWNTLLGTPQISRCLSPRGSIQVPGLSPAGSPAARLPVLLFLRMPSAGRMHHACWFISLCRFCLAHPLLYQSWAPPPPTGVSGTPEPRPVVGTHGLGCSAARVIVPD